MFVIILAILIAVIIRVILKEYPLFMTKFTLKDFLDIKTAYGASFNKDESRVAYQDNSTGTMQLYLADIDGKNIEQLTQYTDRLMFAGFRPHHNQIIFGKDKDGNEHTQFHLYDVDTGEVRGLTNKPDVLHRIGGLSKDGKYLAYASTELNGKDFDVYVMDIDTGKTDCLFKGSGWCYSMGFSPDGKFLVVGKAASNTSNNMYLINIATSDAKLVASGEGNILNGSPGWLSDNSGFYFISNKDSDFSCLDFYNLETEVTTRALDVGWDLQNVELSQDGKVLAVLVNEDGYINLKLFNSEDMSPLSVNGLPKGSITGKRFSDDASKMLLSFGDATRSISVLVWDREKETAWQVSPDHQTIPPEELVQPELAHYQSFDGLSIPVFLYKPEGVSSAPMPVVVQIHGGPEGQYQPDFNPITQYLVANGYAVAAPNVRGSTGYGKKYVTLDDKGKRLDSVQDIVYLRHYLKERPEFDENKIVLTGGSYGGYMVLANLAFYPEYWAAGVDIVGISNFVSFLKNTSIWRRELREAEYGSLEDDLEMLERISPIHKASDIIAPLFIIHGANDPRVPLSEAEQMYDTLKALKRDVELLVYHDEGHGLAKRTNRIDAWSKVIKFLDKRLK